MRQTLQQNHHARSSNASESPAQVVEKAVAGNSMACEQLMGLFQKDIFRMVYYRTRSPMDAEDLTQEIFLQAFKNLSGLKDTDKFKSWLYSIALNKIRDFHRKIRFQRLFGSLDDREDETLSGPEAEDNPDALVHLMKKDFWNHVRQLLDKLSRMEREVFILRFMDHLSIKEVSQVMKKSESTVKTHLHRALQKFRNEPSMIRFLQEART